MKKFFKGGIHPNDNKHYTAHKPIEIPPLPEKVIVHLSQHIGAPCSPLVNPGDSVKKGQLIAKSEAFVSGNIHSPISGTVETIGEYPHPVQGRANAIVIKNDHLDEWAEGLPCQRDWNSLSPDELRTIVREAGIVGMGGATFPTHVKLAPPKEKKIDSLIINGVECEPYLTSDNRIMIECPDSIVTGVKIIMKMLDVKDAYIGIEDNKPEAFEVIKKAFEGTDVKVVKLPTRYPQGAEKMLIKVITNREVPSGGLPMDVGVVVQNISTVVAINDAVTKGIPLIERIVTVSGGALKEPKNLRLRIGTTFEEAFKYCGMFQKEPVKIIMGGPMMGFAQSTMEIPVIKGVSGILALSKEDVNSGKETACIRCGKCVDACPMGLCPTMLSILGERGLFEEAREEYSLLDCIECGICTYVCPSKRNIVEYIRYSKFQYNAKNRKK